MHKQFRSHHGQELEGTHVTSFSLVIEKQVGLDARRQSPFDWRNKFTLLFPQITSTYGSKVRASLSPTTIFHIVPQRSNPFQQHLGCHLCCRGSSTARSCCCTRLLRSNSDFSESQSLNGWSYPVGFPLADRQEEAKKKFPQNLRFQHGNL